MSLISFRTKMQNWPLKYQNTDATSDSSRTDHYGDKAHYMAEDMMRRVGKMGANALNIDIRYFYLYIRIKDGRRCCCFKGVNVEPDGECPVCFGTGIVGGFEKFGTHLEVIDPSRKCVCVNVIPDIANPSEPPNFKLHPESLEGYLECDVDIGYNKGVIDYYREYTSINTGSAKIKTSVKSLDKDTEYILSSDKAIRDLLSIGSRKLRFKIEFTRNHLTVPSPILSHIYIRYTNKDKEVFKLKSDIPPAQSSANFDPNGGSNLVFNSITALFDPRVYDRFTSDDFLYEIEKGLRWKINEVERKTQVGTVTQIQCTSTLIADYESYKKVPL